MALKPITRQEQIIVGKNLEPITRMERFLKEYGGGTGGSVQSDWNQTDETAADFIKNKPFGEFPTGSDTLYWDGNTEGVTDDMVLVDVFVWVSDVVVNANDIPEEGIVVDCAAAGGTFQIPKNNILITEDGLITSDALCVVPHDNYDATEAMGEPLVIPKKGTYMLGGVGPISVTIPGYTGFPGVKKIEEKLLPVTTFFVNISEETIGALKFYLYTDLGFSVKATKADIVAAVKSGNASVEFRRYGKLNGIASLLYAGLTNDYAEVFITTGVLSGNTIGMSLYTAEYTP